MVKQLIILPNNFSPVSTRPSKGISTHLIKQTPVFFQFTYRAPKTPKAIVCAAVLAILRLSVTTPCLSYLPPTSHILRAEAWVTTDTGRHFISCLTKVLSSSLRDEGLVMPPPVYSGLAQGINAPGGRDHRP